jgi:rubrerythrin
VDNSAGYLSFYYSDPLARYPVRELTKRRDNKSDPNIETGTYGLFSTCEPQMRNKIVTNGTGTLFFVTRLRDRRRHLTGYYAIGWYTEGVRGAKNKDWALAASQIRFITPIPLDDIATAVSACAGRFRTQRPLDAASTARLRKIVDTHDDITDRYVDELHRIERFAKSRTGYAYPSWGRADGFSWDNAAQFYYQGDDAVPAPNSTRSGRWRCATCGAVIPNAALLKQCPVCREMATLTLYE